MALAMGFELLSFMPWEPWVGAACAMRGVWREMGIRMAAASGLVWTGNCCWWHIVHPRSLNVSELFSGSRWPLRGPALTVLLCAFQNECMKIWSLLRSGKFSCPTSKELVRSPDGKADLNKCLMCQRLMWVSAVHWLQWLSCPSTACSLLL